MIPQNQPLAKPTRDNSAQNRSQSLLSKGSSTHKKSAFNHGNEEHER